MTDTPLQELFLKFPYLTYYLDDFDVDFDKSLSFRENLRLFPDAFFEQRKMTREEVAGEFDEYLRNVRSRLEEEVGGVHSVEILPGKGKDGVREDFGRIEIHKGEIVAIVGETGSGKSRLLEDIEWQAMGDTPTGRTVLIDGLRKTEYRGKAGKTRSIAQLSQNMNFVLDMNVGEFLSMHAECFVPEKEIPQKVSKVYEVAVALAGESFDLETPVTALSGGQSRALMIADCAYLSCAPIVLIDEIENAGIDRRKAMDILTGNDKIVLIATHDPILSLMAPRRIVIRNGRIDKVNDRSKEEADVLTQAEKMDHILMQLRSRIRKGEVLHSFLSEEIG